MEFKKETVEQIYLRNNGSQTFYKRNHCNSLIYTEGIMDFQKTLNAFWIVECTISHLPKIYETSQAVDDSFFVIQIKVDEKTNTGVFEVYREGYVDNKYQDHLTVLKQTIPDIDLPDYDYKFYLIQTNKDPIIFTLLLVGEY